MPSPYSSLALANEFINRASRERSDLTHMQIQKLVYLAHGWSLAALSTPLVQEQFQAWEYGPVIPNLYMALRKYGQNPVTSLLKWGDDTPFDFDDGVKAIENLSEPEAAIVDSVWEIYGKYPAFQLSALTHEPGTPWAHAFERGRNRPIPNDVIRAHFQGLLNAA